MTSSKIQEQTITEITSDGRVISKKIVTYPGEETTEIEEIEEVDGKTTSVKRSIVVGEKKEVQPAKTLAEIKSEPVVLVPGYRTVAFDEKTNSTIVTEKTTTGYQQTITTIQEDGTKKIQTKTFFDAVEIPGEEEEEEETYEETETFEPGSTNTIVRTITEPKDAVDSITPEKTTDTEITEIESNIEQQTASNVVKQDEAAIVVKEDTEAVDQSVVERETNTKESKTLIDLKYQPIVIVPGHQKREFDETTNTTTVTEKTTTGYQQTITTVATDGRTIVQTKVFYDPVSTEEVGDVEVVETHEETHTIEPTTKTTTTTTITGATNVAESITSAENLSEVKKTETTQQIEGQCIQSVKQQEQSEIVTDAVSDSTTKTSDAKGMQLVLAEPGPTSLTQKKTTSDGKEIEVTTTVSDDGKTKTLRKTVRRPSEEIEIEEYEETETYEPSEVKVSTTTKTIPIVEALEEAAKDIIDTTKTVDTTKNIVDTGKNTQTIAQTTASKTTTTTSQAQSEVKSQINVTAKTAASDTKTEAKQIQAEVKQTKTQAKQTTTEAKQTTIQAKPTTTAAKQTSTTAAKTTTTEAKQITTAAKQTTTEGKQIKTNEKEPKSATQAITGKSTTTSKKDDSQTKLKTITGAVKKDSVVKSDVKTSTTSSSTNKDVATIDKPKVTKKNGETTTEVVRRVPGGTEHTWTTVRADGTTKKESKTYLDAVPVESSDEEEEEEEEEYEEYEEIIEEEPATVKTVTTKTGPVGAITTKGMKKMTNDLEIENYFIFCLPNRS